MRQRILTDDEIIEIINIFHNSEQLLGSMKIVRDSIELDHDVSLRIDVLQRILHKPVHENLANLAEESIIIACKSKPKVIDLIKNQDTKEKLLLLIL